MLIPRSSDIFGNATFKITFDVILFGIQIDVCCVFQPASGCFAHRSMVETYISVFFIIPYRSHKAKRVRLVDLTSSHARLA